MQGDCNLLIKFPSRVARDGATLEWTSQFAVSAAAGSREGYGERSHRTPVRNEDQPPAAAAPESLLRVAPGDASSEKGRSYFQRATCSCPTLSRLAPSIIDVITTAQIRRAQETRRTIRWLFLVFVLYLILAARLNTHGRYYIAAQLVILALAAVTGFVGMLSLGRRQGETRSALASAEAVPGCSA
jgi:hypothetical protein